MTDYSRRVIIIVPAAYQTLANDALRDLAGGDVFTVPLVDALDPAPEASHFICDWQLTEAQRIQAQAALQSFPHQWQDRDHWDPDQARPTLAEVLADVGLAPQEGD